MDDATSMNSTVSPESSSEDGSSSVGPTTGGSSSGSTSTGSAFSCDGTPINGLNSAAATPYGDLPPVGGSGTGSGGIPDDALYIRLANVPVSCGDPYGDTDCEMGVNKWWVTIILPPDLQEPGEYSFDELTIFSGGDDGTDCNGGGDSTVGGETPEGTVTVESIDEKGVVACIETTDFPRLDANGTFTAVNCSGG